MNDTAHKIIHAARENFSIFAIVLTALLIVLLILTKKETTPALRDPTAIPIHTTPAIPRRVSPEILIFGLTETPSRTTIAAAVDAFVSDTPKLSGARFQRDEVLLQLDDQEAILAQLEAESRVREVDSLILAEKNRHENNLKLVNIEKRLLEISAKNVEREGTLKKKALGSDLRVDEAELSRERQAATLAARELDVKNHPSKIKELEAQLSAAKSQLARAKLDVERTIITAPFDGRLARLRVAEGDRVTNRDPLLDIYDVSAIEVRAQIPDAYLPIIHAALGEDKRIFARTTQGKISKKLQLDRVAAELDPGKPGTDGFFRFDDSSPDGIPLNQALELTVFLPEREDLIAVPGSALFGLNRIYVVRDNRLTPITVERAGFTTTPSGERFFLISSERLKRSDEILTTHLSNAISGLHVQIQASP